MLPSKNIKSESAGNVAIPPDSIPSTSGTSSGGISFTEAGINTDPISSFSNPQFSNHGNDATVGNTSSCIGD